MEKCSCFSQKSVAPQENKNVFSDGVTRIGEYYGGEHKGNGDLLETCNSELRIDHVIYSHFDNGFVKKCILETFLSTFSTYNISCGISV